MKTIWQSFTNPNESDKSVVDLYDRVPNIVNSNNLFNPDVSHYLISKGFSPVYPGNKKFAVVISHDVDNITENEMNLISVKHYGGIKSALKVLKNETVNSFKMLSHKSRKDYISKGLQDFLSVETNHKIPASYYFLSLTAGEQDFNYNVADIGHIFDAVGKTGGEIGLHGGHQAYSSAEKIAMEKRSLELACGQNVRGYRNHYLRFDKNVTWQALEKTGFLYDSTYGDAYCPGFRNGMCHPFMPFDVKQNAFINLIEIPLVYMDCSTSKYMFLSDEVAWELFCSLVEKVRNLNGVFTLLWHNTFLEGKKRDFYLRAVDHLRKLDPWFATGQQVAEHYRDKNYTEQINTILMDTSTHETI